MHTAQPSRTAVRVALRRAAHQLYDAPPLVFPDPYAVRILGPAYAEELGRTPRGANRPFSTALRAFIVARSRFAEDCLAAAIVEDTTQYVLLGAGLDTFSLRSSFPALRVFEVDHPATQAWKLDLLAEAGLQLPPATSLVPVDFEQQDLPTRLFQAGFEPAAKTLFAALGVVPYLTPAAFRATLRFTAACPRGSAVVLDYSQPRAALAPSEQLAHDSLSSRVALAGEPFQFFLTPEAMRAELSAFRRVEDLGSNELNARYFDGRGDRLRVLGAAGRLLHAVL